MTCQDAKVFSELHALTMTPGCCHSWFIHSKRWLRTIPFNKYLILNSFKIFIFFGYLIYWPNSELFPTFHYLRWNKQTLSCSIKVVFMIKKVLWVYLRNLITTKLTEHIKLFDRIIPWFKFKLRIYHRSNCYPNNYCQFSSVHNPPTKHFYTLKVYCIDHAANNC